eukprot:1182769-Amphidinium_carterae.4
MMWGCKSGCALSGPACEVIYSRTIWHSGTNRCEESKSVEILCDSSVASAREIEKNPGKISPKLTFNKFHWDPNAQGNG